MTVKSFFAGQTGLYPLSLSTSWKAIPDVETEKYLEKQEVLQRDQQRADDYQLLKPLIDKQHLTFIDQRLAELELDWNPLLDAVQTYQKEKEKKKTQKKVDKSNEKKSKESDTLTTAEKSLARIQTEFRKTIVNIFTTDVEYKQLFDKEIFTHLQDKQIKAIQPEQERQKYLVAAKKFKRFSVYFKGYHKNRKNMYSDKEQQTALAYRIVHENFPRFLDNLKIYICLLNKINESEKKSNVILEKALKPLLNGKKLDDIFSLNFFNHTLTQKGIDFYNQVLGGISDKNQKKIQGINEIINQLNQNEKDKKKNTLYGTPVKTDSCPTSNQFLRSQRLHHRYRIASGNSKFLRTRIITLFFRRSGIKCTGTYHTTDFQN